MLFEYLLMFINNPVSVRKHSVNICDGSEYGSEYLAPARAAGLVSLEALELLLLLFARSSTNLHGHRIFILGGSPLIA